VRLVKSAPVAAKRRRPSAGFALYRAFGALVIVVAVLGAARVSLTVAAAQSSLRSDQLRDEIRMQRYYGDMLEVRLSALGSPSRLREIATATMGMVPSGAATRIDISQPAAPKSDTVAVRRDTGRARGAVASVLGMAAGEAQVLLVGDVGLTSAR
jgi:hypothetical protein